jgi:hypothetical protein
MTDNDRVVAILLGMASVNFTAERTPIAEFFDSLVEDASLGLSPGNSFSERLSGLADGTYVPVELAADDRTEIVEQLRTAADIASFHGWDQVSAQLGVLLASLELG